MRTAAALLTLSLLASSAAAEDLRLVPPPEYDHPYDGIGQLYITYAKSQDEVRELCPGAPFPKAGAFGCSRKSPTKGCWVVLAPEEDMKKVGIWMDLIRRHEIAHCNGWPGDHRGALPVQDWATPAPVELPNVTVVPKTPPRGYIQR